MLEQSTGLGKTYTALVEATSLLDLHACVGTHGEARGPENKRRRWQTQGWGTEAVEVTVWKGPAGTTVETLCLQAKKAGGGGQEGELQARKP